MRSFPRSLQDCSYALIKAVPLLLLLFFLVGPSALAQSPIEPPPGFDYETVIGNLDGPTSFAVAPDGRIFITQKAGAVKVFHNGSLQSENFIDLSQEANAHADRGLMSVAVHPNFPATPYVYFAYVYEPPEAAGHRCHHHLARKFRPT